MNEYDDFVAALSADEDNITLRFVFADWLDERGRHEEADRQRRWPAAKAWFVRICRENNPTPDSYSDARPISYEDLIEMGRDAVDEILLSGKTDLPYDALRQMLQLGWDALEQARLIPPAEEWEFRMRFGNSEGMMYAVSRARDEFWKNWSIITGVPLPTRIGELTYFSCGC